MTDAIQHHRETALESPYSRDREAAIEELADLYPGAGPDERREILRTLRRVAGESSSRSERDLAQSTMVERLEADPEVAAEVVVPFLCDRARDAKFSDERTDAIDALGRLYPELGEADRERVGETLADVAGDATYEDERRLARQRLSDVSAHNRRDSGSGSGSSASEGGHAAYLCASLADHLERAAGESPDECLQRAEELRDFVAETPVDDGSYEDVRADLDALVEQLEVAPTGDQLDDERRERVERIAERARTLYDRSG